MKVQTHRALYAIAFMFAFSVVFAIATLTGFTIPSALIVGELAGLALIVAPIVAVIVMALVPATIIKEERLTIRAPREAVYAALDPRSAPRYNPTVVAVDDLVGEPEVVGTRWRTTRFNGTVFTSEVVAAEPPARLVTRSRVEHPARLVTRYRGVARWSRPTAIERVRTLVATPAGTQLTIRVTVHTVLLGRIVNWLLRSQAARIGRSSNERFREDLEAGAVNREVPLPS